MRPAIAVLHARPGPAALHDEAVTGEPILHYTTLMLGRPGFNHPPRAIHTSVIASPASHRGALDCATPGAQPGACSLVLTDTWREGAAMRSPSGPRPHARRVRRFLHSFP